LIKITEDLRDWKLYPELLKLLHLFSIALFILTKQIII